MEETATTETGVSQVQIDEMNRTVTLMAGLTASALIHGDPAWERLARVGMDLDHIQSALVESGMAPAPTPSEE